MTLTNYWWLLIWVFAGGVFCSQFPRRMERLGGRAVERWDPLPAFALMAPFVVWAAFRPDWADTSIYRQDFLNSGVGLDALPGILLGEGKDKGFYSFNALLKVVIGNQDKLFFLFYALVQTVCLVSVFRRYSAHYWLCIFLFVASTDYMSWMFNGMRQFTAACLMFAGFDLALRKRYGPLIALILAASTIHGSALIMLPVIFIVQGEAWNGRTLLTLAATAVVMVFVDEFTPLLGDLLQETQYDDMMTNGIWDQDDGTNIIRVLVYSMPALLSLVGLRHVRAANDPVMNLCVNCSIVTMALYLVASVSSGIYIGRLPIYTTLQGYIALPWIIDRIFEKRSAELVKVLMILLYVIFFYLQMNGVWGLL